MEYVDLLTTNIKNNPEKLLILGATNYICMWMRARPSMIGIPRWRRDVLLYTAEDLVKYYTLAKK